jgi:uncharacterized protein (TIGR02271 family)
VRGTLDPQPRTIDGEPRFHVRLAQGEDVLVPADLLSRRADGGYTLALGAAELDRYRDTGTAETTVIPRVEERLRVGKRRVETGKVTVHKTVHEHQETVDQPLVAESVEVERVPINRYIEQPVGIRQEGDVTIVPVLEEVLVVDKKLLLKEEVRITRRRTERHDPRTVVLRREEIEVDPARTEGNPDRPST